jgi:hypothetical protein
MKGKNERYRYISLIVVVVESDYGSSVEGMVDHAPRVGLGSVAPPSHKNWSLPVVSITDSNESSLVAKKCVNGIL